MILRELTLEIQLNDEELSQHISGPGFNPHKTCILSLWLSFLPPLLKAPPHTQKLEEAGVIIMVTVELNTTDLKEIGS